MSEPKFTKGPWQVQFRPGDLGPKVVARDGSPVASDLWFREKSVEDDANAHLIAAAPDLYAALDACLDLIHNAGESHTVLFDQVVSALAKARGEVSDA
jgi:hypothetical protein